MSAHSTKADLEQGIFDTTGKILHIGHPDRGALLAWGDAVPADGTAGYATGCLFMHTDGGAGTALYCNEGTKTACDFDAVTVA